MDVTLEKLAKSTEGAKQAHVCRISQVKGQRNDRRGGCSRAVLYFLFRSSRMIGGSFFFAQKRAAHVPAASTAWKHDEMRADPQGGN